ncbi:MAG: TIGR02757 family protein [Bacteroidia bacterium]|nr:TIGR02757 family protein [Bacteroidia bacterium]
MKLSPQELKEFLDEKYEQYNRFHFIESDPISIPHRFIKKEDIEIAGFLTAAIAWGQRITIINNATKLMQLMENAPHEFILNASNTDLKHFQTFVHRTFNGIDATFFIKSLQNIYKHHGGLEHTFTSTTNENACLEAIVNFRNTFFSISHPARTEKHVSNPAANSSSKRLCMYLRWMIRKDKKGVDFGIWKNSISMSELMCPLDVHTGNVSRKLGLLKRSQNDWKAVNELSDNLRKLDPKDPIKYDFALFGLGVFEKF